MRVKKIFIIICTCSILNILYAVSITFQVDMQNESTENAGNGDGNEINDYRVPHVARKEINKMNQINCS